MSVASAIAALSPSSYWKFDNTSFPMTDEQSVVSGSAAISPTANQPGITPGDATGKCVHFDAADGDGVTMGDVYDETGTTSFTVLLFAQTTTTPTNNPYLVNKQDSANGWGLRIVNGSPNVTIRMSRAGSSTFDQGNYTGMTLADLTSGTTKMFAMRYNGTSMILNINGVDVKTTASSLSITDHAGNFMVGRYSATGNGFDGYIDDVAFWDGTALSESQLLGIWQAGTPPSSSRKMMMMLGVG